jgi:hypothetical protein
MGDFLQSCIILLKLNICSCFVVVVKRLVRVKPDCLVIEIESFIEILLLECFISLVFSIFGRVFNIHLLRLLFFLFGRRGRSSMFTLVLVRVGMFLLLFCLGLWLAKFLFLELFCEVLNVIRA